MDNNKENKRKKDKHNDSDDYRSERTKRRRSRSRSPYQKRDKDPRRKRKHSKSRSPVPMKQERRRDGAQKESEAKTTPPVRKPKETDMLNTRTGGAYIPPARLRMMQAQITDKSSPAYQRLAWEALKKSIHGHINKINVGNIGIIIKELLKENIVRGRGLLCRSVIQAQAASPTFTNVYAALVAAVNSRFPNIGELLLKRLVIQFKRGFKRNDKPICISSASFIAHLVNQRVAHEILALELLTLLVETPTDDSVEVAIAFLKECGQKLTEVSSKGVNAIFEMLRNILHEGQLDKRVQYMIEVMFQVWKDGFKDHPAVLQELELVPEEEQFTHLLMLDDATDAQDILNVFKFDEKYEENEEKYKGLSKEILGSDIESGDEDGSEGSGSEESEDEEENKEKAITIIDNTETNLVALRRTIYLTINSSLDFEECAHKLMKMQLKPGQEIELCHMFLDCCAEQRTYEKFYGLLAQRFCNINRIYISPFEEIFKDSYSTAHRLDTNRLRNVSKFFAHLLFTDSISWEVLDCVKLNEEDTTSSSRIYIKILFQELAEYMGLKKLNDRLQDPTLQSAFFGIFPRDNPKNTRFSINFFTSIGLGGLTDELREHLKQMPKNIPAPITEIKLDSESSSDSSSSSSDSSDSSSSDSEEDEDNRKKEKKGNKEKSKKTPKTPEIEDSANQNDKVERWGHDGFYDTYGHDARRNESRPIRERDGNDFRRGMQSTRQNEKEHDRYNDNRHARDRREDRRIDPQEYRRESERDTQYRENSDKRRNYELSDRRHDDRDKERNRKDKDRNNIDYGRQEDTARNRDVRNVNEDRSNRNRQERVVNDNNDPRKARERDQDQSDRRNDEQDARKKRNIKNKDNERNDSRRSRDRNDNEDYRRSDDKQLQRNDDRNSRKDKHDRAESMTTRDVRKNADKYNQESSNRQDNREKIHERVIDDSHDQRRDRDHDQSTRRNNDRDARKERNDINKEYKRSDDPIRSRNHRSYDDSYSKDNKDRDKNEYSVDDNEYTKNNDDDRSKRNTEKSSKHRRELNNENDSSDDSKIDTQKSKNSKKDRVQNDREVKDRDNNIPRNKGNKEKKRKKDNNDHKLDKSIESDEDDGNRRRREKDKKKKIKAKDLKKKNSVKSREKKQAKRDKRIEKDNSSESEDTSSDDNEKKKKANRKRKSNSKSDSEDSDSSDSSDSSNDAKNMGGRYWDTFDISGKDKSMIDLKNRTSQKSKKR